MFQVVFFLPSILQIIEPEIHSQLFQNTNLHKYQTPTFPSSFEETRIPYLWKTEKQSTRKILTNSTELLRK